jgi:hypothetical protein
LNLSRAQAGMMKAIQGGRGWPDLFIAESNGVYHGLFIEIKPDETKLLKLNGMFATPHIKEQYNCHIELIKKDYKAAFTIGFDEAKEIIDNFLQGQRKVFLK